MKRMSVKKMCITVAAACLLVSGITAFAGGAAYFVTGSSTEPEYTDYRDMEQAQEQLGYAVDSVERFANGYAFDGVSVETIVNACTGESGRLYSISAMDIRYRKGAKTIDLNINEKVEDAVNAKEPDAVRMCGDIELRYDEYTDKLVPASYELTEEDRINEQRDDYNIVYMSVTVNEVEEGSVEVDEVYSGTEACVKRRISVSWEKDGVSYHLTGTELDLGAEEMLDMAEEILAAK